MELEVFTRSECGRRENNEDALLVDTEMGIFVVADGMGGHAAGEIASSMAVQAVHTILVGHVDPDETRLVRDIAQPEPADVMRERLRYATNQASVQIRRAADAQPQTRGMGTTIVILVIDGDQAHLAHVGDSRAYLIRGEHISRLTRDHTVVQQEVDAGRLTAAMAREMPHRNILTQSVGFHGPVEPDTSTRVLEPGDLLLLCSDGLTDVLDDNDILQIMLAREPEDLPDALTEAALSRGTEDNVTVVVVAAST